MSEQTYLAARLRKHPVFPDVWTVEVRREGEWVTVDEGDDFTSAARREQWRRSLVQGHLT